MKNKKVIIALLVILLIIILLSIFAYKYFINNDDMKIPKEERPPLKLDILKDEKKIGKTVGIITSWKYNDAIATSSLVTANVILEKEKAIEEVQAGDTVRLSLDEFKKELSDSIYQITYNAISDEDIESPVLPIDEIIDFSNHKIEVPVLRENINKTLYYYVSVSIKEKGTIMYYFKIKL